MKADAFLHLQSKLTEVAAHSYCIGGPPSLTFAPLSMIVMLPSSSTLAAPKLMKSFSMLAALALLRAASCDSASCYSSASIFLTCSASVSSWSAASACWLSIWLPVRLRLVPALQR